MTPRLVSASAIQFNAIDLTDTTLGEDLWSYQYHVDGFTFSPDQGFTVYFNESQYSTLSNPQGGPEWDILLAQPDVNIPAAGFFDALNLSSGMAANFDFSVDVVWLGGLAAPGSQFFERYELINSGITILETGDTVPSASEVPEPASLSLTATGLIVAIQAIRRARRRKKH